MERLISSAQLAERLGVVPSTICQWTREGLIPAVRIRSNLFRYDYSRVRESLERLGQAKAEENPRFPGKPKKGARP